MKCIKCNETANHDKGDITMKILPHYYCSDCMIWQDESGEWTDGVDYWNSRGENVNYG